MVEKAPEMLQDIAATLRDQIEAFKPALRPIEIGTVLEVGDGIARVSGLAGVQASELVEFSNGVLGIAFNLEADNVGVIIMGDYTAIEEGTRCGAPVASSLCRWGPSFWDASSTRSVSP